MIKICKDCETPQTTNREFCTKCSGTNLEDYFGPMIRFKCASCGTLYSNIKKHICFYCGSHNTKVI